VVLVPPLDDSLHYAGHPHLSGATEVARIDAAALGLVPFMVRWLERIGSRPEPE